MNIWPMAPQAAKESIAGRTVGLRCMKAKAAETSEEPPAVGESGVGGIKGEMIKYTVVRMVERTF